jgi:thiosulfate dehydrogenase
MKAVKIIAIVLTLIVACFFFLSSGSDKEEKEAFVKIDFSQVPNDKFGNEVKYGRDLMLRTAYYIGPEGIKGKYLGNKMNCTNCHQDAGTKPFSFSLILSHEQYPQYRPREAKVLTLTERINNCIERPHNGKPLPSDSREMVALLSYFKWINGFAPKNKTFKGSKNMEISFPQRAADPQQGARLFQLHCQVCHGTNGEGKLQQDSATYIYPPLWGNLAYQSGSSMHRVIKQAQWLKANMPFGKTSWEKPFLSDGEALDLAAFVNDDAVHIRQGVNNIDYPHPEEKSIDYARGPFVDTFTSTQHKLGPFQPIIRYWKNKGLKPVY